MKKTLFAMAALALMGGQAFALTELRTSDMAGQMVGSKYSYDWMLEDDSLVTVDGDYVTGKNGSNYAQHFEGVCTAQFVGDNVWKAQCGVDIFNLNITSTQDVAQSWIDTLADGGKITLFQGVNSGSFDLTYTNLLLEGTATGQSVTLIGTTDTMTAVFKGRITNVNTLAEGDIALLQSGKTFSLVGNGLTKSGSTPEPATATLSLLALAGLASRRRRK